MAGNKLYSPDEIKALLERATELQKNQKGDTDDGLTIEELEEIASDSGIDPAFIRQAISEQKVSPASSGSKFHLLGGPTSLEVGREIPYELSADEWELVVQEARRTFNKSGGSIQKLGNSLEWVSGYSKFIQASLTATPSKGKTRFYVTSHFKKIAFFFYYFPFVLLMMALGASGGSIDVSFITGLTFTLVSVITVFSGVRFLFGRWVNKQKNKLEDMVSRFEQIVSSDEQSVQPEKNTEAEASSPHIEIPEEDPESNEIPASQKGKTRS